MTRVDLIIPTHNAPDLLDSCLQSLCNSSYTDFNLIVVDDASRLSIREIVRSHFSDAKVIRNDHRVGLARVFNLGIAAGNAEFVVLLNDDTEVEPDWLHHLVSAAGKYPLAGSVASKIRLMSDRQRLHSAGDTYSPTAIPVNRGVWLPDLGQYDSEELIFGACAGAALYRRSALEYVKLPNGDIFDRHLFMYCEDVDLNWRLQRLGLECAYAPKAIVYHHLSATGGGNLASYYVSRNIWLVKSRSVPRELFGVCRSQMVLFHFGRFIRNVRKIREPAARTAIRGTIAGLVISMFDRSAVPPLKPDELNRIVGLLDQTARSTQRNRSGIPHQWD